MCKYIELSQGQIALVDDEDFEEINQHSWYYGNGYALRAIVRKGIRETIWMHHVVKPPETGKQTDHINGDGLDNRKVNLRSCSCAENQHNSRKRVDNTSGYKGITKRPYDKWEAKIQAKGKRHYIGTFGSLKHL